MKALIVDDSLGYQLLMREYMKIIGIEAIFAKNGKDALDILEKNNDINFVLMDVEMPVLNGLETTRIIRTKLKYPKNNLPVFVITAHEEDYFREKLKPYGFTDYLPKDCNPDDIKFRLAKNGITV